MVGSSPKRRLFLIDGSSHIYRAYFAIRRLSTSRGMPTNAVFGFTSMLLKLLKQYDPEYIAVVMDAKGPTFRHQIYDRYKANRPEMPEDLVPQIPYIKRIVEAYRIPLLEVPGYEADDIIGTIAKGIEDGEVEVVIVSGDKDLFQLVDSRITVLDTMRDRSYDARKVRELYGVPPERLIDVFALMGDAIDNIPGVPSIGEKRAKELIQRFGSLEGLLENTSEIKQEIIRQKLIDFKEQALLSRQLATIDTRVPIRYSFEDFRRSEPDESALNELFIELEFTKFLSELTPQKSLSTEGYRMVLMEDELDRLIGKLEQASEFAIDTETTAREPMRAELVGISVSCSPHEAFYIPLAHRYEGAPRQLSRERVLEAFRPLLESEKIRKYGQNIKYDILVLGHYGIELKGIEADTMVASYLLNPSRHTHNLEEIAREYLNHRMTTYKELTGTGQKQIGFDRVDVKEATLYACEDADVTFLLAKMLVPRLINEGFKELFFGVEMPLIPVLAKMERNGVKVDPGRLEAISEELASELDRLMGRIYEEAGEPFNINSPQQLGRILFEKLKLPVLKKTKTGYSTGMGVLTELAKGHPLPAMILEYRSLSKLKSTYVDVLPGLINPKTGRIHTSYNQTVTATGRLSSSDPNLQNIPIRTEEGRRIREAFVAEDGHLLLSADYSQIELRILAHVSEDPTLIEAFLEDEDIHSRTAAEIFGVAPDLVSSEMRREAKVINFGIIYGMSAFGLAKELGVENRVAQAYIEGYFKKYRGVKDYIDRTLEEARQKGFVSTLKQRRRYLPEINSKDNASRRFAERIAINTPIQGTAADLIKIAMISIDRRMQQEALRSKMILQVHDELVFEAPEPELEELSALVKEEMEGVMEMKVPLKVELHWGRSWAEAH